MTATENQGWSLGESSNSAVRYEGCRIRITSTHAAHRGNASSLDIAATASQWLGHCQLRDSQSQS